MSHRAGAPPIECPLASLGRNTPALQGHQVTYQHPLSTSPLDPQVYQMSRQSPLLNMGDNHMMYTPDGADATEPNAITPNLATTSASSSSTNGHPSCSSHHNSNSANNSQSQPAPAAYRAPPLRNYTPIEAILAFHERLSPVPERNTSAIAFNRSLGHGQRTPSDHPIGQNSRIEDNPDVGDDDDDDDDDDDVDGNRHGNVGHPRNSNNVVIVNHHDPYYLEDKHFGIQPRNVVQSERYYLEDQMAPFNTTHHQRHDETSPSHFLRRASSPSETSGSDRYNTSRPSRASPAIHSHYKSHSSSTSGGYGDCHSSLTRFSPSLDQGYATLVSPSPSSGPQTPGPWNRTNQCRSGPMFDRLTDDAVLQVFQWLDSCELCNVSRVCRRFEVLAWRPVLWKHILLKGEQIAGDRALKAIFRRLCGQTRNGTCAEVERVMLNDGCRMSDKGLQLISRRCPELTHLQVQYSAITNNTLFDLVTRCSNLQHLDITGCSQITTINFVSGFDPPRRLLLQYLDLTDCCAIGDDGLKIIVRNCPQLLYLYLRRCLQISDAGLRFVPSFCVTLRELSVSDCGGITDFGLYELAKLGSTLRYLSVAKCDQVSDAGLKVIARRCYKLRYLNARGCEAVSDDSIIVLAGSCPRLRALDIGKCDVSDAGLRALAESCPNLKKLSLKNCDMITDRGVQCVAYYCRGLQQLNIQDCQVSIEGYRAVKRFCKRCVIEHTNPGFY